MGTKRILITAGPTWVPIDNVRVISNIATGETGILLAEELAARGAKVTLLLGPVDACCLNKKIRLIRFKFFDELKNRIIRELKSGRYDIVIHSAAVSDYRPKIRYAHKISSGLREWKLNLVPAQKIIDLIKKTKTCVFLVGFKFEPAANKKTLINKARALMKRANLNLAVANSIDKNRYCSYIVSDKRIFGPYLNKVGTVKGLIKLLGEY